MVDVLVSDAPPPATSRKVTVPSGPRSAIQYVEPDWSDTPLIGTVFQVPATGPVSVAWPSSAPGCPAASA